MAFNPFNYLLRPQEIIDNYEEKDPITTCYLLDGNIDEMIPVPEPIVTMSVLSLPDNTTYFYGDYLDRAGLNVQLTVDDIVIDITNDVFISPALPLQLTDTVATLSYTFNDRIFTSTFQIVVRRKLTGISVNAPPTKTNYFVGDTFDPSGMVVIADFLPDIEVEVVVTWTPLIMELTTTEIVVSYSEHGITATDTQNVTVEEPIIILPLNDYTWSEIQEISANGLANTYFNIGDYKEFLTSDSITIRAIIIGFDHDYRTDNSLIGITFMFEQLHHSGIMHSSASFNRSFVLTQLYTTLNSTIYNTLPSDLRSVISPASKFTAANFSQTLLQNDEMVLWFPSATEIADTFNFAMDGEGVKYEYFNTHSPTLLVASNGLPGLWWLRSPANAQGYFCYWNGSSEAVARLSVATSRAYTICFCI